MKATKHQIQAKEDGIAMVLDGLMTIPEVMAFLNVSRTTLYKLMDDGHLEYVKLGNKSRRIPRRAVIEYAARNVRGGWAPRVG